MAKRLFINFERALDRFESSVHSLAVTEDEAGSNDTVKLCVIRKLVTRRRKALVKMFDNMAFRALLK